MKYIIFLFLFSILSAIAKDVEVVEPDTSDIERPCDFKDIKCIRKVITKKGWCSNRITKKQPANQPFKIKKMDVPMPSLNISDIQENMVATGLDKGKVVEFYFNKKTDQVVFSVKFTNINIESTTIINYNRKAKEPIYIKSKVEENYPSFTTTTILEGINKRKPKRHTTTFLSQLPEFHFSDGIQDICDAEVRQLFEVIFAHAENQLAEIFLVRGPVFEDFFVNNVICGPQN